MSEQTLKTQFSHIKCDCKGLGPAAIGPSRGHFIGCPRMEAIRQHLIQEMADQAAERIHLPPDPIVKTR